MKSLRHETPRWKVLWQKYLVCLRDLLWKYEDISQLDMYQEIDDKNDGKGSMMREHSMHGKWPIFGISAGKVLLTLMISLNHICWAFEFAIFIDLTVTEELYKT